MSYIIVGTSNVSALLPQNSSTSSLSCWSLLLDFNRGESDTSPGETAVLCTSDLKVDTMAEVNVRCLENDL